MSLLYKFNVKLKKVIEDLQFNFCCKTQNAKHLQVLQCKIIFNVPALAEMLKLKI